MALIKSISGIRGTIGGKPGEGLSPIDVVTFAAAYGTWLRRNNHPSNSIVLGRDARISGEMVSSLVANTLIGLGWNVLDIGLSTTPTVELAVPWTKAAGGIIITASHNPAQWNALKLLNSDGEFISDADGKALLQIAEQQDFQFSEVFQLGKITQDDTFLDQHIQHVLDLPWVDVNAIVSSKFRILVDAVNSTGGIVVPHLLKALGAAHVDVIFGEPTGHFAHNPEPLPENLTDMIAKMKSGNYDLGIVVDPDVDRLCFINEDGTPFGEEYTLVAVADYVLSKQIGNTVSNLSSTRALRDVTESKGGHYFAAAVGEVNVVNQMKAQKAIIGGEGNGGVIFPESHYGRDALVGIGLFLTHLANSGKKISELRASYPAYVISKNKIELSANLNVDLILDSIAKAYQEYKVNTIDGVKIDFPEGWVHLRKSNTEPIIRIYAEASTEEQANTFAQQIMNAIEKIAQS
ncbi:phosphoglucosamine mutase [Aquirufa ecclesiirivi]|uniref:Phosphoglucosamine mutase n=1 Tax=Aquirufa ecclesiirivi TaxID=2715124 RepID=A0ABT4JIH2_9BACT|nr:phosphoglucosamine mutase [Aquirufa ecclesiirivi]MCZ2476023.1 phosphoglucosamine mutase [Aquirufa ecclesiirivi]MDF0692965.1 phosphoglucosamine mutase [Aquirufa ecclesiirivi]